MIFKKNSQIKIELQFNIKLIDIILIFGSNDENKFIICNTFIEYIIHLSYYYI